MGRGHGNRLRSTDAPDGLKPGEPVIVEGGYNLPDGTQIKEQRDQAGNEQAGGEARGGQAMS